MTLRSLPVAFVILMGCAERLDFRHQLTAEAGAPSTAGGSESGGGAAGAGTAGPQPLGADIAYHVTLEETCDGAAFDRSRFITAMRVEDTEFRVWGQRQEYMADENVFTEAGDCVIRAENRATGGAPYTSGTLNTAGHFEQLYGFFEARLKPPAGVGFWSVFWLRTLHGWPPAIDLLDYLDQSPARATVSYWWSAGAGASGDIQPLPVTNLHDDYHVFGCEWRSDYLAFFLDGQRVVELAPLATQLGEPLYPSFNLSVPTDEDGRKPPDATTVWPSELRIDWVRVYAAD